MTARIQKKGVKVEICIKDDDGNIVETYECDYLEVKK